MLRVRTGLVLCVLLSSGCSRQPDTSSAPAAAPPQIQGTLNQVMRGILFPNSNVLFDAQEKDPGAPPEQSDPLTNPYAGVYGGWEALENASIALYESANLIQLPGRTCQNGKPVPLEEETFRQGLAALREVSLYAYKTAQAKNTNAIPDVGEKLAAACATCHDIYRDRLIDNKPMTMEQRCVAG
jgi:hypothetical protein